MNTTQQPIEVIKTKRGNDAILASELHKQLQIKTPLSKWMPRMLQYGFEDGKDFYQMDKIVRLAQGGTNERHDWVLSIDTAKEIAMIQRTDTGKAIRNYLLKLQNKVQDGELLSPEACAALIDLVGCLGFKSARRTCEALHFNAWEQPSTWWAHRAKVLGYSVADLRGQMQAIGKRYKNRETALMSLDKNELIRVAVVDLFIGLGKNEAYAKNMGAAAKLFAEKLPPVFDNDTPGAIDFRTPEQMRIISKLRSPALLEKFG